MAQKGAGPNPTISIMRIPANGPVFLVIGELSELYVI